MAEDLGRVLPARKTGAERLHESGQGIGPTLLEFWRWSASDLVSNSTRGVLAEFIVGSALGVPLDGSRDEWAAFDLLTPEGIKVEVKSAAYVQGWFQKSLSPIIFKIPKTRGWDPTTNLVDPEMKRQADVYVFALLDHRDKPTIDPMNIRQWKFWVVPTRLLDERTRSQTSITLRSLEKLAGHGVQFEELRENVRAAAAMGVYQNRSDLGEPSLD